MENAREHGTHVAQEQGHTAQEAGPTIIDTPPAAQEKRKAMTEVEACESIMVVLHKRPELRQQLRRRIDLLDAEEVGPPEPRGPRFTIDKAHGEAVPLAKWLLARTMREKLTGHVMAVLGYSDTRDTLQHHHLYDGDIYEDLVRDWGDEISRLLASDASEDASPSDILVAGYTMALETARP